MEKVSDSVIDIAENVEKVNNVPNSIDPVVKRKKRSVYPILLLVLLILVLTAVVHIAIKNYRAEISSSKQRLSERPESILRSVRDIHTDFNEAYDAKKQFEESYEEPEFTKKPEREEHDIYIFSHSDVLYDGGVLELKWGYADRLEHYNDEATVCLSGYDVDYNVIQIKDKSTDKVTCYSGIVHGLHTLWLGNLKFTQRNTQIYLPQGMSELFDENPRYYVMDIYVADDRPSEGLTEWAGRVGFAYTDLIHNGEF